SCAEMIERPALLQHLGEFGDANKLSRRFFCERVQSYRDNRVGRLDEDESVAQMSALASFASVNDPHEIGRGIPVKVEICEASVCLDILPAQVAKKRD